jgi:hypothetical protein
MTIELINLGSSANDNTGDPLRLAFTKCNNNFSELYSNLGPGYVPNPVGHQGEVLVSDGTSVVWTSAPFGNTTIYAGDTPPSGAQTNNLWFDSVSGRLYIYYGNNWVDANPPLVNFKLTPPDHAVGAMGDQQGQWSADYNYYYYCVATFGTVSPGDPIWRRIAFDTNNSW